MDFLMVNSVNSYVKSLDMQGKWKRKKDKADFSADYTKNERQRLNEQFKQSYMEQQKNNESDKTLSAINDKIAVGAKLTPDEMKYLQVKNPAQYQKLKELENEKKQYEEDLKKCKTKEDVEKLKMSKVSSSLSAINAVKNNPNIPESKKLEIAVQEQRRLGELSKIEAKFVKSGEYARLPAEAEKIKAEQEIREAEENSIRTQQQNDNEKTQQAENNESAEKTVAPEEEKTEKTGDDSEKPTVEEAKQSPEAKKVRRAKAKKAYKSAVLDEQTADNAIFTAKG